MALPKALTILLVEDDEGHAMLIEMNLREAGIINPILHLMNGSLFFEYIQRWQSTAQPNPLVVFLDINLPDTDGFTILAQLKANRRTRKVPVFMLSSTDDPNEIKRCYELGCSLFVRKPLDYATFVRAIRQLGSFLSVIEVPIAD